MKLVLDSLLRNAATVGATAERISHPKDGALAQQPEAERAPHSAVVRPQAAGKSRSTTWEPIDRFVSCGASGNLGLNWTGTVGHFAHCWPRFELKECWFEPTRRMGSLRRGSQRFLAACRTEGSILVSAADGVADHGDRGDHSGCR